MLFTGDELTINLKTEKVLSIEEIYERVKEYDLVLTIDAPLADGLNSRIDKPRLGTFATTPKRLAFENWPDLMDKRQLFYHIAKNTDLNWKLTSYLLDNVLDCWKTTGELEKVLEYREFKTEEMKKVIKILRETRNVFREMDEYSWIEKKKVAIIAPYQFDGLDKKVLPEKYDSIDVFGDGERKLPGFSVFNSETGIVRAIARNISRENANDMAIVIDSESRYQYLIESLLESEGIPFMSKKMVRDDASVREFLSLCRVSLSDNVHVSDVRPFFHLVDTNVSMKYDNQFLERLEIEELKNVKKLLDDVSDLTFAMFVKKYEEMSSKKLGEFEKLLDNIDFSDKHINEKNIDMLEYYLDSFEVSIEKEGGGGVLFVSPKGVAYIDRPVVFYIGMDSSWTAVVSDRPWNERKKEDDKNLKNFRILLQNGTGYYLVQDKLMSKKIVPCFYFNEITTEKFDTFSDFRHERFSPSENLGKNGFLRKPSGLETEEIKTLSQSSLNTLVKCPRDYFFSRLVSSVDMHFFKRGNLFHDFAEFCVNYPDFTEKNVDKCLDFMIENMRSYVDDIKIKVIETEFRIGINNVISYIRENKPESFEAKGYTKEMESENVFSEKFGKPILTKITETWFENNGLGTKGKVDLILSCTHLLDYKTGKRKSASNLIKNSNVTLFGDDPNFQAILYLLHKRAMNPNEKLEFTFFHVLDNVKDVMNGEESIDNNFVTLTYYPENFSEKIMDRETFDFLCNSDVRRKLLDNIGYENYKDILNKINISEESCFDKNEILKFSEEMICLCEGFLEIGRGKDITEKQLDNACKSILKQLVNFRIMNYFREDLDEFEKFLKKEISKLNEYMKSRFPVGDIDRDKIKNKDLVLDEL